MTRHNDGRTKTRRPLTEPEAALWRLVTQSVSPLRRRQVQVDETTVIAPAESIVRPMATAPVAPDKPKKSSVPAAPQLAPLDRRLRQRLARGSETIDQRIDLHGLTQNEAHRALISFLRGAQSRGARNVLVITGKGVMRDPHDPLAERGVLRRQVPFWLRLPELRDVVVGFESAHVSHGGEGALYVRLRRPRD